MLKEKIDDKTTERLIEELDKIGLDVNWRKAVIARALNYCRKR